MRFNKRMKRNTQTNRAAKAVNAEAVNVPDFAHLADVASSQVEHQTVLEFLRMIPNHKWHPDEIAQFGSKVGRMANSMQLAFVPSLHPSLGVIRCFPVPLMQWVYATLATKFGWPQPALALEDASREQREELRRHEAMMKLLQCAAERAPTDGVSQAVATVLDWMDSEAQRLRGGEAPEPPPPLRAI